MIQLKPLSAELIPQALKKAERYRLLNEPREAESICLDILEVDAQNQEALVWLLLALTDQIGPVRSTAADDARKLIPRLQSEYDRKYYEGIIAERTGKARLNSGGAGSGFVAYEWLRRAMRCYEEAEAVSPPDNNDAVLRWNSCARMLANHPEMRPAEEDWEPMLLE